MRISNTFERETCYFGEYPQHKASIDPQSLVDKSHIALRTAQQKKILDKLPACSSPTHLHINRPAAEDLLIVKDLKSLTHLRLISGSLIDFSPLTELPDLQYLYLESNSKVTSLQSLAKLSGLKGLKIENFSKVTSLDPIRSLIDLRFFAFEGNLNRNLKVESLEPLSGLTKLEVLHLTALAVTDELLVPLNKLEGLSDLRVGVCFPAEQFARLAGSLPECDCKWFEPTHRGISKCSCGHHLLMLSGKRLRDVCPECSPEKLHHFLDDFRSWKEQGVT